MEYREVPDDLLDIGHHLENDEAIREDQTLPNTVAPEGEDSFSGTETEQSERWGVTPLYTTHHEYAYPGEYLCDPATGEPAMKREDGTVVNVSEIARFNYHVELFSNAMSYLGMRARKIYSVLPDDDTHVMVYDGNCIDGEIKIALEEEKVLDNLAISFDLSVLTKIPDSSMLRFIDRDPVISVEYQLENEDNTRTDSAKLSDWRYQLISVQAKSITLKSIRVPSVDAEESYVCFIHSILLGY